MPVATAKTTNRRTANNRKTQGHKPAEPKPDIQPARITTTDPERPQDHNGIPVVREELLSNIPGAPFRISRLHLADDTMAFACRDCLHTANSRGQVMEHRNQVHGSRYGKKSPRVKFMIDKQAPDPVLPPRGDHPAPSDPLQMTLAEILALAPSLAALGELVESLETETAKLREEIKQRELDQHKIDVYDSLHDEVIELRLMVRQTGPYEKLRAEVLELRTWKKKMIQRLTSLGFNFTEEEQ